MAIQKKSLISSRTTEKKSVTKPEQTPIGEPKGLTAKALQAHRLLKGMKYKRVLVAKHFKK
ncbi:MAG TPA: hypothetical protein VEI26_05155 [Terriglobales bacterium]|nr:hypothetical protein [Terriglobales bacterium]